MSEPSLANPADPAYFAQAATDYETAMASITSLAQRQIEVRESLRAAQAGLSERASEIQLNGGTTTVTIDGSNQEKRKAQLELAISSDPGIKRLTAEVRSWERSLAIAQAAEVSATNKLSFAKRRLDYAIAFTGYRTASINVGAYLPPMAFSERPKIRTGGPIAPIPVTRY